MHVYGCIRDKTDCIIVMGAITVIHHNQSQMKEIAERLGIDFAKFFISNKGTLELTSFLSILFLARFGRTLNSREFFSEKEEAEITYQKDSYTLTNTDEDIQRHGYEYERNFLEKIPKSITNI